MQLCDVRMCKLPLKFLLLGGHGSDTDTDASSSDEMEESSSDSDNEIKNNENSAKKSKENAGSESSLSDNNDGLDDYAKMSEAKRHNTLSKREVRISKKKKKKLRRKFYDLKAF